MTDVIGHRKHRKLYRRLRGRKHRKIALTRNISLTSKLDRGHLRMPYLIIDLLNTEIEQRPEELFTI